jgi:NitT/TauT family transport system substrate-binding protein
MKRAVSAAALAMLALGGCSSGPAPHLGAVQAAKRATKTDLRRSAGTVQAIETGQVLRLGYADDLASPAVLSGLQSGAYRDDLAGVTLEPVPFASYLQEISALEHGQLDAAYIDPVAAIAAWQSTGPDFLHIVAGAGSGTSELIARPGISRPAQLHGKRVEAPADSGLAAALAEWVARNGLAGHTQVDGSAVTSVGILQQFKSGVVSAAWEPAPLAQELIAAGGHALASQPSSSSTAVLVVTQRFLTADPGAITSLLKAQIQACADLTRSPSNSYSEAVQQLDSDTAARLPAAILPAAFGQVTCTDNPLGRSIQTQAAEAASVGILKPVSSFATLYNLSLLNELLRAAGQPPLSP